MKLEDLLENDDIDTIEQAMKDSRREGTKYGSLLSDDE